MWEHLLRVDWRNLHHAYGRADDAPAMLWHMVASDPVRQAKGWQYFWGALHHQGDYYNSTVAVVPFLIEAAANPAASSRAEILAALENLWQGTSERDGYPLTPEPPGGRDIPTPLLSDAEFAAAQSRVVQEPPDEHVEPDEDAFRSARPADLCAWQTGRAVWTGREKYLRLLEDADAEVVRTAASLLGLWAETRETARQAIARTAERAGEPKDQVRLILEFGKSGSDDLFPQLQRWLADNQPLEVRTAAALAWAWATEPAPLPAAVVGMLEEAARPKCKVFPNLPLLGVYSHWGLPTNLGWLILRLARSTDRELRWRMVQNFEHGSEGGASLADGEVVPVLLGCLSDRYGRIRNAAAQGLAQRGPSILDLQADNADALIKALKPHRSGKWGTHAGLDSDAEACGHLAHLLACGADRLTTRQRKAALTRIKAASERFRGQDEEYVTVGSVGHNAFDYLREQHRHLTKPARKSLDRLLAEIAFPENDDRFRPLVEADRELADRYERSPPKFLASLRNRLSKTNAAAWGAVEWLWKLGPDAAYALQDLNRKAATIEPPAARWEIEKAASFVRWAKRFKAKPVLKRSMSAWKASEWIALLKSRDVHTRVIAAEAVANQPGLDPPTKQAAVSALRKLLNDDASCDYGVKGRIEVDGRLFFWRMERQSPRAAAITALFALDCQPENERLFRGMLAESARAAKVCGDKVIAQQFPLKLWRMAVQGAGGMSKCEPLFSRALKELAKRPYSKAVNEQYACADEINRVMRALTRRRL